MNTMNLISFFLHHYKYNDKYGCSDTKIMFETRSKNPPTEVSDSTETCLFSGLGTWAWQDSVFRLNLDVDKDLG